MRTIKDCKEFAEEELKRIKDGSDDALRDFEALKTLCDWIRECEEKDEGKEIETIKIENNKVIIELSKEEIKHLLEIGVLFEPRKDEFKFLDKEENIFIRELKEGLKNNDN